MGTFMTKRVYRETRHLMTEDQRSFKLNYFLTQKQSVEEDQVIYGVAVTKEGEGILEEEVVDNLSYQREDVESMLSILANNLVTPISMVEILDDLVTVNLN